MWHFNHFPLLISSLFYLPFFLHLVLTIIGLLWSLWKVIPSSCPYCHSCEVLDTPGRHLDPELTSELLLILLSASNQMSLNHRMKWINTKSFAFEKNHINSNMKPFFLNYNVDFLCRFLNLLSYPTSQTVCNILFANFCSEWKMTYFLTLYK